MALVESFIHKVINLVHQSMSLTNDIKAIIKMNLKYGFVKKACNLR